MAERMAPQGITKDDIEFDSENPNIARATPRAAEQSRSGGTYPDIVEGSDSERTGTSWGVPGVEESETVETAGGERPEGTDAGGATPNRNTGDRTRRDDLQNVGSWSTIETHDSAGSPTGNS